MNNILFKILMLKGDAGEPTDEQTQSAVDDYMQTHPEAAIDETIINSAVGEWLDEHPEATTTVQDGSLTLNKFKPKEMPFVTPEQFGASGDGIADDTAAMQAAIDSGVKHIKGIGTYRLGSRVYVDNKSGLLLSNLKIISKDGNDNATSATIDIKNSDNIFIENCEFYYGISVIHLFTCSDIFISNNLFDSVGYSIIQEDGYASNNVTIENNHCKDAIGDFVECNCEINAPSKNWIINGNLYDRTERSDTYKNENRFVGMTAIENVVISNNIIVNTRGHAIHGEDFGGRIVIANNIFVDNVGNDIEIENGLKTAIVQGNYFYNSLTKEYASRYRMIYLSGGENRTEYKVRIDGNTFIGNGTQSMPIFLDTSNIYEKQVTNNSFYGFDTIFEGSNVVVNNLLFANNIVDCEKFINNPKDFQGGTIVDAIFSNNKITGDIYLSDNGNGSAYPTNIEFNGNIIKGDVTINACRNFVFANNIIPNTFAVSILNTLNLANNGNIYSGRMNHWTLIGSKGFTCSVADSLEYSGITFTVPENETWEVYVIGSYSNSVTKSYAFYTSGSTQASTLSTRFNDCGLKSPICVCPSGTYYVWVAQGSGGGNSYDVYAKSV